MADEFTSMSLNEVAAAMLLGHQPLGVLTTARGRKAMRFTAEARDAVVRFNKIRDEVIRLLDIPDTNAGRPR